MLKKMFYYNMYDLQKRGKDIAGARKGVLLTISVIILIGILDLVLLNMDVILSRISLGNMDIPQAPKTIGQVLGVILLGIIYFFLRATAGNRIFFEEVSAEYMAMTPEQQKTEARIGKYYTIVPFVTFLVLFFYLLFTRH